MPRILTPGTHSEETLAIAHDLLPPGWQLAAAPHGRPEFFELLKDTEYYIGAGQFKHGPEFYRAAPKLRIVQTLSAGYNTYDLEAARAAGVPICNNGGANSTAVAEHAMLLMLAVCRRLIWQHEGVVSGRWRGNDFNSAKLYTPGEKRSPPCGASPETTASPKASTPKWKFCNARPTASGTSTITD